MHLFRPFSQGNCCSNLASNLRVCHVPTLRRRHEKKAQSIGLAAVSLVCVLILAACNCAPTLRYITISPTSQTIAVGTTQQFTASGYYSNGAITPGISVSWSSSSVSAATIDGVSWRCHRRGRRYNHHHRDCSRHYFHAATLNVNQLKSITITPLNQTIAIAGTEQYDAMGTLLNPGGHDNHFRHYGSGHLERGHRHCCEFQHHYPWSCHRTCCRHHHHQRYPRRRDL